MFIGSGAQAKTADTINILDLKCFSIHRAPGCACREGGGPGGTSKIATSDAVRGSCNQLNTGDLMELAEGLEPPTL